MVEKSKASGDEEYCSSGRSVGLDSVHQISSCDFLSLLSVGEFSCQSHEMLKRRTDPFMQC